MIPIDLHYQYPTALYLIFGTILLIVILQRLFIYRQKRLAQFAEKATLSQIVIPRSQFNFWLRVVAIVGAWLFAVIALMGPKGNGHYPIEQKLAMGKGKEGDTKEAVIRKKAHDVIFLVDASASMDVTDTRTGVTRLELAKEVVDEVVRRLSGESVALHAFTSDTTKLSPATMDYLFVRLMLKQMKINEGDIAGTNLIEAVADMRDHHFSKKSPKLKTLIILTDGGDTRLETLSKRDREREIQAMLNILNYADELNVKVFTIGLGTEEGADIPSVTYQEKQVVSSLDEDLLKQLSQKGGGKYYFANEWNVMELAQDLIKNMGEEDVALEEYKVQQKPGLVKGVEDLVFDLYFQIPLGVALVFLVIAITFPETRIRKGKKE